MVAFCQRPTSPSGCPHESRGKPCEVLVVHKGVSTSGRGGASAETTRSARGVRG